MLLVYDVIYQSKPPHKVYVPLMSPPINACPPPMWKRPKENPAQQFQVHHGKFNFTAQIQIHHVKFKFTTANSHLLRQFKFTAAISNSPRPFQILHGKFSKSRVYVWVARRVWARDSESRAWTSSFVYQLWNIYIKFALSENQFKDFSAWTPLTHFVIQRWRAGIHTRRKIHVFSTPRVKFDCH